MAKNNQTPERQPTRRILAVVVAAVAALGVGSLTLVNDDPAREAASPSTTVKRAAAVVGKNAITAAEQAATEIPGLVSPATPPETPTTTPPRATTAPTSRPTTTAPSTAASPPTAPPATRPPAPSSVTPSIRYCNWTGQNVEVGYTLNPGGQQGSWSGWVGESSGHWLKEGDGQPRWTKWIGLDGASRTCALTERNDDPGDFWG